MGKTHGEGGFAGLGGDPSCGFLFREQENEAGEIFGVVLEVLGKNHTMVIHCRAAPGDGGARFISAREHFADTAGSIFRRHALQSWMGGEKVLALREGHGMGSYGTNVLQRCPGAGDEMVLDGEDGFGDDAEIAFEQKIVNAHDGASERIFDRNEQCVGGTFFDGAESCVKRSARHCCDGIAEKLNCRRFAEGAGFALESHAHGPAIGCAHRQALSCMMERKTKSGDSLANKRNLSSLVKDRSSVRQVAA